MEMADGKHTVKPGNEVDSEAHQRAVEAEVREQLRKCYEEWDKKSDEMRRASANVDWSGVDWSKLNPKDVGVELGPAMTEEQFAEYRKKRRVQILGRTTM
jgi:hypothetical protein